ncbi:ribonuclease H-like domain-containing protein [Jimgerdemannia flammicorona]|uniref:Ribonuclease H-like domain-containing protein n=1 Tax=Jimgerdemannia flammicorona TaxID=994334 RepID=A0A433DF90_9FUNG|nr:ribonuclease H-like domain-containing protein [Jimgerdemannia flammicorona]
MEILRDNFSRLLPKVQAAVDEAEFIAIDAEFSGLNMNPQRMREAQHETLSQRYDACRAAAQTFAIIQFGLCTFSWDSKTHCYAAKPFNFYVFPTTLASRAQLERTFTVQASAFDFLTRHSFDFNKWIYQGIPYMTVEEEESYRVEQLQRLNDELPDIRVDEKSLEYMRDMRKAVDEWLADPNSEADYVNIVTNNGYQRRLVYQELRNSYKGLTGDGRPGFIHIRRINEEERAKKYEEKKRAYDASMVEAIGFRKVIDMMSQSRKPVLGHNMLLDIAHLVQQFVQPLPDTVGEFKTLVHRLFPTLIDTKYICAVAPELQNLIPMSSLDSLRLNTSQEPFADNPKIETHWEHPRYFNAKAHEAGYDAYMTGFVFLRLIAFLLMQQAKANAPPSDTIEIVFEEDNPLSASSIADQVTTPATLISAFPDNPTPPPSADADTNTDISHEQVTTAALERWAADTEEPIQTWDYSEDNAVEPRDSDEDWKSHASSDMEEEEHKFQEPQPEPLRLYVNPPEEGGDAWRLLRGFENKVNLGRGVVAYVDFVGEEVVPPLTHIFHLTSLPARTRPADLVTIFKRFGKVFIDWPQSEDASTSNAKPKVDTCFVAFEDLKASPEEVKQWVRETLLVEGHGAAAEGIAWKGMQIETMVEYLKRTGGANVEMEMENGKKGDGMKTDKAV